MNNGSSFIDLFPSILNAVTLLVVALIGYQASAKIKYIQTLENRINRYKDEIRARQAEEDVAAAWLVELKAANSEMVAKKLLRDRTEQSTGLRPDIPPSEIKNSA